MNYSSAIFLVNKDVRAVSVSYEVDKDGKGVRPFMAHKTMDHSIVVGDYVAVPTGTRHDMTVCRVEEVDVEVPLDSSNTYNWIIAKIDTAPSEAIIEMEKQAIDMIKDAQKKAAQQKLRDELLAANPDLQVLANIGEPGTALPAPAAPPEA